MEVRAKAIPTTTKSKSSATSTAIISSLEKGAQPLVSSTSHNWHNSKEILRRSSINEQVTGAQSEDDQERRIMDAETRLNNMEIVLCAERAKIQNLEKKISI